MCTKHVHMHMDSICIRRGLLGREGQRLRQGKAEKDLQGFKVLVWRKGHLLPDVVRQLALLRQ